MISVKDIVKKEVEDASSVLMDKYQKDQSQPKFEKPLTFLHGHFLEIVNTLSVYTQSEEYQDKKYPLVALIHDFEEKQKTEDVNETQIVILIANFTEPTLTAEERYEKNFYPVLYPIYNELINQLNGSPNTLGYHVEHSKIDRLFLGKEALYKNAGVTLNDFVDAIELKIKLKTIFQSCSKGRKNF